MPDIIFVDDSASVTSSASSICSRSRKHRLRRRRTIDKLSQFLTGKKSSGHFIVERKVSEDVDASYAAFCHAFTSVGQTDIVPEWQVLPGDEDSVLSITTHPAQTHQHHHHQSPPIPQAGTGEDVKPRLSSGSHRHSWNRGHWVDVWQAHSHTKTSYPETLPSWGPSSRPSMSDESTLHTLPTTRTSSHSTSITNVPSLESDDHGSLPSTTPSFSPFYYLPTLPEKPHAVDAPRANTLPIEQRTPRLSRRKSMWEPLKSRFSQLRRGRSTRECMSRETGISIRY